jgi:hypothetical protein
MPEHGGFATHCPWPFGYCCEIGLRRVGFHVMPEHGGFATHCPWPFGYCCEIGLRRVGFHVMPEHGGLATQIFWLEFHVMPVGHDGAVWAFASPAKNKTAVAKTANINRNLIFIFLFFPLNADY